jgi:hypothetical protein
MYLDKTGKEQLLNQEYCQCSLMEEWSTLTKDDVGFVADKYFEKDDKP